MLTNVDEFTRESLAKTGVRTHFIEPGSPWENGYVESFNGKLRDECLNGEVFETLLVAQLLIKRWRHESNTFRPHSSLGYRLPAPEARMFTPDPEKSHRIGVQHRGLVTGTIASTTVVARPGRRGYNSNRIGIQIVVASRLPLCSG